AIKDQGSRSKLREALGAWEADHSSPIKRSLSTHMEYGV
ncbi:hypothetical protein Tco_0896531, partial [Tanacetum coccineum]